MSGPRDDDGAPGGVDGVPGDEAGVFREPAGPEPPGAGASLAAGVAAGGLAWFVVAAGRSGGGTAAGVGLLVGAVVFLAVRARELREAAAAARGGPGAGSDDGR